MLMKNKNNISFFSIEKLKNNLFRLKILAGPLNFINHILSCANFKLHSIQTKGVSSFNF